MEDPNFPGLAPDWYLEDLLRFGMVKDGKNVDETVCLLYFIWEGVICISQPGS